MYPQSVRNWRVVLEVNSGPPSEDSSSGIPKVTKVRLRQTISPVAPSQTFQLWASWSIGLLLPDN